MSVTFITTGVKELDAALAGLEPKLQKKAVRKATRNAAKLVASDAKDNLQDFEDEGHLQRSIKIRAIKRSRTQTGHQVEAGGPFDGTDDKPWYAGFVELGTQARYTKSGAFRGAIYPRKYLRPALYDNRGRITKMFERELRAAINALK